MQVTALDAADPESMAAWHATYHEGSVFGRAFPTPWTIEEMRAQFLGEHTGERLLPFAGYVGAEPVTVGIVWLPTKDNLTLAGLEVVTRPALRRRGHGSAMLDHLTSVGREQGRTTMAAQIALPYDGPADGHGHADADFAYHRGYTFSQADVMRVLDLPVDGGLIDRLAGEAAPYHSDYAIRQFAGPVPGDIIDSYGELVGSLVTEAPMGELQFERQVMDGERIRADEAVLADSGRMKHTTVAIAPDGAVTAYSELVVPRHDRDRVYQWGTLVAREHRGHRLGLATKVANLRRLQAEEPARTAVVTFNAEVNAHMIGVNAALGFRPVERMGEFMRVL